MKKIILLYLNNLQFSIFRFSFFTVLLITTHYSFSQDTLAINKVQYIELDGIVKKTKTFDKAGNENLDSSKICVYNESKKLVAVFYTNKKGKCKFRLPLNKKFTIEIGKKGFVSKLIEVNTKVPPERKIGYGFPFEISIFEELKELDTSILQKPIAKISFSMSQNQFAYDYMNTDYINNELRRQYKEYYFLREVDADFKKDSLDTQNKK